MANLKDINYGIGKYLEASDASDIPDIGSNRKNLDLLNFKVATNNAYALYNFKDGMIDAYQTETGVDAGTSTNETYDSSGKYYSPTIVASTTTAFTSNGAATWTAPAGITSAEILVVAGGGGGGDAGTGASGGGGAGGIVHHATYTTVPAVVYDLTVGDGGDNGTGGSPPGDDGDDSSFNDNAEGSQSKMTALGGGGGGQDGEPGRDGGSGGGEGADEAASGAGQATQGNSGGGTGYGNNAGQGGSNKGGGGGGANAVGADSNGTAGAGGVGKEFSSFGAYGTNSSNSTAPASGKGYFGGGGGGGANTSTPDAGAGGAGGGATGTYDGPKPDALDNTGGGGGGGAAGPGYTGYGGTGGSGIVLIKTIAATLPMTLISNAQTAQAAPTEGRLMLYEEDVDAITLDTDLKGYVSRDGGTTYTQTPLVEDTVYGQFGLDANTILLLHCDGADSGTTFTDSSFVPNTMSINGSTHTDTTIKKFGTASAQFDGTDDYLYCDALLSGNNVFTVDCWVYPTNLATNRCIFGQGTTGSAGINLGLRTNSSGGQMSVDIYGLDWVPSGTISQDVWTHVALSWDGTILRWFINGTLTDSNTLSSPFAIGSSDFQVGSFPWTSTADWLGYIDEFRVSNVCRWTSSFTEPPHAYGAAQRILSGSVDISGQPAGSNMKYKVETLNDKKLKLHGASLLWA
jgi:hypothetical protein